MSCWNCCYSCSSYVFCYHKENCYNFLKFLLLLQFQAGTGDEFLDELLSNDASLDEGAVPDIKVMDSSINMSGNEVRFE